MSRKTVVLLENLRSAHNVGSIIRTCDGAGVSEIYLCGITPDPTDQKVLKTSLGAEKTVKWEHFGSTVMCIERLRSDGYFIAAVELTNEAIDYRTFEPPQKVAFIFGNEKVGIGENILQLADKTLMIPMHGSKYSLNVSISAGIMLFQYI